MRISFLRASVAFIAAFHFSTASAAISPGSAIRVGLLVHSAIGIRHYDRLKVEKGSVIFNLTHVSPDVIPAIAEEIRTLAHPITVIGSNCSAGSYTLDVEVGHRRQTERGCLDTDRAHRLVASFARIEEVSHIAHVIVHHHKK